MAKYKLSDIFQGDYPVSQFYGANPAYYAQFGLNGHEGVDYKTPPGIPVLAPFDGTILRDNDDFKNNAYGNHVIVWDPIQKCAVWHCHLSSNSVTLGQKVKRGEVVGKTGNSGNSTGPHLHENFVETDAQGNRLNMNNGKQGFLNILDSNLVEWVSINSSPTPQPPMNDNITRKASAFDKFVSYLFSIGALQTDNSDNVSYENIKEKFDFERNEKIRLTPKAVNWDKACNKYKINSDTSNYEDLDKAITASQNGENNNWQSEALIANTTIGQLRAKISTTKQSLIAITNDL